MRQYQVVLVNHSSMVIPRSALRDVAAALSTQVNRDLLPEWKMSAAVAAGAPDAALPEGAWPINIVDRPVGGLGIHLDHNGQPYAQVMATPDWSITASHELLEMLVDPFGRQFKAGRDITPGAGNQRANYLVEVCDPCEVYTYDVEGVRVSDFVSHAYYDAAAMDGARLDFLGRLTKPLTVPRGCYLSWQNPGDGRWHQKRPDGTFVRSDGMIDPERNPRDDRDAKLPEEGGDRHDLDFIRASF